MPLLLSRKDVMQVLEMKDCMEVVEKAFAELANGTAVLPLRINITPPDGLSLYMPAYLKELGALACKIVTVYKNNPKKYNMPVIVGKVLLQDPNTGDVICIMDGGYLTAVRTGAASGVATKYLARRAKGQVAGIFGAGVQAGSQLWAVAIARELSKALVYDAGAVRYHLRRNVVTNADIRRRQSQGRHPYQRHRFAHSGRTGTRYDDHQTLNADRRLVRGLSGRSG